MLDTNKFIVPAITKTLRQYRWFIYELVHEFTPEMNAIEFDLSNSIAEFRGSKPSSPEINNEGSLLIGAVTGFASNNYKHCMYSVWIASLPIALDERRHVMRMNGYKGLYIPTVSVGVDKIGDSINLKIYLLE